MMERGAFFSPDRTYRYDLWRGWDDKKPVVAFIGLNPSTADENTDDPTIRRCIAFAQSWGYGRLYMVNLFALRATDPKVMKAHHEPIGKMNDERIRQIYRASDIVIAAWGKDGTHLNRDRRVRAMLPNLYALRISNKTDQPWHPLYLPADSKPVLWPDVKAVAE